MNLHDICLHVNNFFQVEVQELELEFDENKISGEIKYLVKGQYIHIEGSLLNDGIYKIVSVGNDEITVDEILEDEKTECKIYGLAIPKAFLQLADKIMQEGKEEGNVQSESVSRYSVNYGGKGSDWTSAYKTSLDKWRKLRGF